MRLSDSRLAQSRAWCRSGETIRTVIAHVPLDEIPISCPVTVLKLAYYASSAAKMFKAGMSHLSTRHDWLSAVETCAIIGSTRCKIEFSLTKDESACWMSVESVTLMRECRLDCQCVTLSRYRYSCDGEH